MPKPRLNEHKANNCFKRFIWLVLTWVSRVVEFVADASWGAVATARNSDVARIGSNLLNDLLLDLSSMTETPFVALQHGATEWLEQFDGKSGLRLSIPALISDLSATLAQLTKRELQTP